jgi:hypothetical protein
MKPYEKEPFRRQRRRWKDNITISFRIISCGNGRWIELAHIVPTVVFKPLEPKFMLKIYSVSTSRKTQKFSHYKKINWLTLFTLSTNKAHKVYILWAKFRIIDYCNRWCM